TMPDGQRFWYKVATGPSSWEYVLVDPGKGERKPGFNHDQVATALGQATRKELHPRCLPIEEFALGEGVIHLRSGGKTWAFDPAKAEIKPAPYPAAPDQRVKFERLDMP